MLLHFFESSYCDCMSFHGNDVQQCVILVCSSSWRQHNWSSKI